MNGNSGMWWLPAERQLRERRREAGPAGFNFSLASMFVVTTLVAVQLGLLVTVPLVGFVALATTVPAAMWTARRTYEERRDGNAVTWGQMAAWFMQDTVLTLVGLVMVGSLVAIVPIVIVGLFWLSEVLSKRAEFSFTTLAWGCGIVAWVACANAFFRFRQRVRQRKG